MNADQMFIRNGRPGTGGTQQEGWLDISDLQEATADWADATFPQATTESVLNHLRAEILELCDSDGDPEEAADCLLLLCHFARKRGFSLLDEAAKKLRKNMKREWETVMNADGYFHHTKEAKS